MALTVPNEGEIKLLAMALGKDTPIALALRLYTACADVTSETNNIASFTEVGAIMGYTTGGHALTNANWTVDATGGHYPEETFTFTAGAGVTVLGYYVVDTTTNKLLWAEAFSSSAVIPAGGGTIKVTLNIKLE